MATPEEPRDWITNFHDAYLNANLIGTRMMAEPFEADQARPDLGLIQPRFRLERIWHCFLYVVVEAWIKATHDQKQLIQRVADAQAVIVEKLIDDGRVGGYLDNLRATRDYMCHRDRRTYWDEGRLAVIEDGMFQWALSLDKAFSQLILTALNILHSDEGLND